MFYALMIILRIFTHEIMGVRLKIYSQSCLSMHSCKNFKFLLVRAFESLLPSQFRMNDLWSPFQDRFADYSPNLLSALILLLVGIIVAWFASQFVRGFLKRSTIHRSMAGSPAWRQTGNPERLSGLIGTLVFLIVLMFFLVPFFDALNLTVITAPLNTFLQQIFAYLPRIISAGLLLAIAWAIATVVRMVSAQALASMNIDRRVQQTTNMPEHSNVLLSTVISTALYYLVFLFFLPPILEALALPAVLRPIQNMINEILIALPNVFAAGLILGIAYLVGFIVKEVVTNLLAGFGFDTLFSRLGLMPATANADARPSRIVGYIALSGIMLTAAMEAARQLNMDALAVMLAAFLVLAGNVIIGIIIFVLGLAFAQWAARVIRGSRMSNAPMIANIAQAAILFLSGTMALKQMGIADEIVNLAFALIVGGAAVAGAIAFGLGGQDVAKSVLQDARNSAKAGATATGDTGR
jgi:hypothetical protein